MSREFRHVLRVSGTNIDGTKNVVYGLIKIIGVGPSYAAAIVRASELKSSLRMGELSEAEIQKLEDVMHDPQNTDYRHVYTTGGKRWIMAEMFISSDQTQR